MLMKPDVTNQILQAIYAVLETVIALALQNKAEHLMLGLQ